MTLLNCDEAVSAYPVRMRVVNVVSRKEEWITVALIPFDEEKKEPSSTQKASGLRALLW